LLPIALACACSGTVVGLTTTAAYLLVAIIDAPVLVRTGVRPELEVFDLGHVEIARSLIEKGLVEGLPIFQLCLGIPWGILQPQKTCS